jgi:FtsP/CotA-like multicopper oxidase with cupredoxin domain
MGYAFGAARRMTLALLLIAVALPGTTRAQEAKRFELAIAGHHLVEGGPTVKVRQGDKVELVWHSDEPTNLHLHGYDLEVVVLPGEATVLSFQATTAGRFPVSSHGLGGDGGGAHRPLVYIEVHPE